MKMAAVPPPAHEALPEIRLLTPEGQPTWNSEINFIDLEITNLTALFQFQNRDKKISSEAIKFQASGRENDFILTVQPYINPDNMDYAIQQVGFFIHQVKPKLRSVMIP